MLDEAKEVCPTTTQSLLKQGYTLVDVRERDESARLERGEDPTAADTSERKATAKKRKGRGKYKS